MTSRPRRLSVTEAARSFADLVNRAYYRGETTILVRNGVEVAYLAPATPSGLPASEALARWRTADHLDAVEGAAFAKAVAEGRAAVPPLKSPWD